MQFIFLIWPILLLPVFVTWLTRPRRIAPLPPHSSTSRRIAVKPAAMPSPVISKPAQQLTAIERRRNSPAYRRAAVEAYKTMLTLEMDDHDEGDESNENDRSANPNAASLQGKDVASSRS